MKNGWAQTGHRQSRAEPAPFCPPNSYNENSVEPTNVALVVQLG